MNLAYIDCFAGLSGETLLDALMAAGSYGEQIEHALARLPRWEAGAHNTGLAEPLDVINRAVALSALPVVVKQTARVVFNTLYRAEAATLGQVGLSLPGVAHWQKWDEDELRAAVGVVLGLALMGIKRVDCSAVRIGVGATHEGEQAGRAADSLALSPVTAEILRAASIPIYGQNDGALVTPVGAALVATLVSNFGPVPAMTLSTIGHGVKAHRHTRIFIGEATSVARGPAMLTSNNHPQFTLIKSQGTDAPEDEQGIPNPQPATASAQVVEQEKLEEIASTATSNPYITAAQEWISLSIKGHQQSGRQRA